MRWRCWRPHNVSTESSDLERYLPFCVPLSQYISILSSRQTGMEEGHSLTASSSLAGKQGFFNVFFFLICKIVILSTVPPLAITKYSVQNGFFIYYRYLQFITLWIYALLYIFIVYYCKDSLARARKPLQKSVGNVQKMSHSTCYKWWGGFIPNFKTRHKTTICIGKNNHLMASESTLAWTEDLTGKPNS